MAFITSTGSFLPGEAIENDRICDYLGTVDGEEQVRRQVLTMNGIRTRHYALDTQQQETHSVYQMAALAAEACLRNRLSARPISYLSSGTTHAPLSGPGISSIVHALLAEQGLVGAPLEINSNAGICSASATALVNAYRAVECGAHHAALCIGAEQSTQALKSTAFQVKRGDASADTSLRRSPWFSAVFLRFMLSDGAGACLVESAPARDRVSLAINWSHSRSYASEAPLCMKYDNRAAVLSQDIEVLTKYLFSCADQFVAEALHRHRESLDHYRIVLPHLSSYFFRGRMERIMARFTQTPGRPIPYWTNLATAGNTGAASILVMLDEFVRTHELVHGDRLLLFVPESGQFNFVMISLTAVRPEPSSERLL